MFGVISFVTVDKNKIKTLVEFSKMTILKLRGSGQTLKCRKIGNVCIFFSRKKQSLFFFIGDT